MNPLFPRRGVFAATLTPITDNGDIDHEVLARHCRELVASGCEGVTLFGTTGEGPSFTVDERRTALDKLLANGLPPDRIIVGTGCAAIQDTTVLTRHAAERRCAAALVLPPFFFKEIDDDGVVSSFAALLHGMGERRIPILLYNIPQFSGVNIRLDAIDRLLVNFSDHIAGIKDSTAEWSYTAPLLQQFSNRLTIYVGAENHLPQALAAGGAGTICGLANIIPGLMRRLYDGDLGMQVDVEAILEAVLSQSFVPVMKAIRACQTGDRRWLAVRPPLTQTDPSSAELLYAVVARRVEPARAAQ